MALATIAPASRRGQASDSGLHHLIASARSVAGSGCESRYGAGRFDRWITVKSRQHPAFSRVLDRFG
jgi:hypothetical protein